MIKQVQNRLMPNYVKIGDVKSINNSDAEFSTKRITGISLTNVTILCYKIN